MKATAVSGDTTTLNEATQPAATHILFLCPHGGAKSVIAATYFNRIAQERALPFVGISAAADEPYDAVPEPVAGLLEREGFAVRALKPRAVDPRELTSAAKVISIDCDLAAVDLAGVSVERWEDVPMASVDLAGSAAAIRRHVEALAAALA